MTQMHVTAVDERDSSWEDPDPHFRVYLQQGAPGETGGSTWTYDVTGADVLQVIDWAQRQAGSTRTYSVALVRDGPARVGRTNPRGLIWLVGVDGNDRHLPPPGPNRQSRMLARVAHPVVVPDHDRAPEDWSGSLD